MSRTHIEILKDIARSSSHVVVQSSHTDWPEYKELWQLGYFDGAPSEDEKGVLFAIGITGLTSAGWSRFRELEADHTSIGIIKRSRWKAYAWFFSIVAAVIAGLLVWYFTHD